jgi:hypothetical protein
MAGALKVPSPGFGARFYPLAGRLPPLPFVDLRPQQPYDERSRFPLNFMIGQTVHCSGAG